MRIPIAVQVEPFEIESIQPQLDQIRIIFARYLDTIPPKSNSSKHGLMGPVGKILYEVRSGRSDAASLKGYALRVQEQANARPSVSSIADLEKGIEELVQLMEKVPLAFRDRLIDKLDYGLYFDMRKRTLEKKEAVINQWQTFLSSRYSTIAELNSSWKEEYQSFDKVMIQKKSAGSRAKDASAKQVDTVEFWESIGKDKEVLVAEEEQ
ncbi:MAG: hypothetical protein K2W95_32915 [Candidatus Obscuribacterales bacterium]|nr:hypothetical protein [Candidatus Obscuribacterales bacterium]